MLPSRNRLSKKEILEFLPKAKGLTGGFLFLKMKQNEKQQLKVGVSVSKKISKSAVKRNFLRRSVYGFISQNKDKIKPATLFFIFNKIGNKKEIENDIGLLMKKAEIFKED